MTTIGVVVSGAEVRSATVAIDAAFVAQALEPFGEVVPIPAGDLLENLGAACPDIVFHATQAAATTADRIGTATLLEQSKVPFTGSDWQAIAVTSSRRRLKDVLGAAEVATAAYTLVESPAELEPLKRRSFPLALFALDPGRPFEDCMVAETAADLERFAAVMWGKHSTPFLVERHLQGVTFCCIVLGNGTNRIVLPPVSLTSIATPSPDGRPWIDSLPDGLHQGVERVALAACRALGLRDLSRIDVALSDAGVPHVVAVDALPSLTPGATNPVSLAGEAAQLVANDVVRHCLIAAAERTGVALLASPGIGDVRRHTPPRGLRLRRRRA